MKFQKDKLLYVFSLAMVLCMMLFGTVQAAEVSDEKNGEIYIIYTSDIHCGINKGFGLAGLRQIRDTLESQGYTTILVDDGDAIQG